ncbi:MAG: hypothetical protein KF883_05885 [Thermomicrobiales bacterium]|nr:hypothetical protein [Thermomicrobiales bacterium]
MSIVLVHNPIGRVSLAEIQELFRIHAPGETLRVIDTSADEAISRLIAPELADASVVVAAGGDGTVSGVAAALLNTGIPLGIVPAGSTNMVARVMRVPLQADRAVQLIVGRHTRRMIDAGVSGDRVLLHQGGAGLDARIFERSSPAMKRRFKWLAYAPPALKSLGDPSSRVTVTADGVTVDVSSRFVLIANSGALLRESFTLMPGADSTDGLFDVGIFTADSWPAIAATAANLPLLRWKESSRIIRLTGSRISVAADPPIPYEFDGDVIGLTPFDLTVHRQAICMICGN